MAKYIDFGYVKAHADPEMVLDALGIEITRRSGAELRIHCPDPDHDDENASCDVNTEQDGTFYCHSCHAKGSIIDLVALTEGGTLREAAQTIGEICGIPLSERSKGGSRSRPGLRSKKRSCDNTKPSPAREVEANPFVPFTTTLRLDPTHSFSSERNISIDTAKAFGMGYQDRGMFKDRWCIPVHDPQGSQLGYVGRSVKKRLGKNEEKWLFPPSFPKREVLFNFHRLKPAEFDGLILVEGALDCVRLHGFDLPVVALLGSAVSAQHIELLLDAEVNQVIVMFDGDAPGRKAAERATAQLAQSFYVLDLKLPDGEDPETLPRAFFDEHVWWL